MCMCDVRYYYMVTPKKKMGGGALLRPWIWREVHVLEFTANEDVGTLSY